MTAKKRFLALLLVAAPAFAGTDFSFDVTPGVRTDDFHWNIAGDVNGQNPNILSELTWRSLKIQQLKLGAEAVVGGVVSFRGSWTRGRITAGNNQDSDYLGDDRSYEFSRSNNAADMGETGELNLGVGPVVGDPADAVVIPQIGWVNTSERLFMTDGRQTLCVDYSGPTPVPCPTGSFRGLNSHYEQRWRGVWIGVTGRAVMAPRLEVEGSLRYHHRLDYRGEADWNLRNGFMHPKSYEHEASGKGLDLAASFIYTLSERTAVGGGIDWRSWRASNGTDRTFNSDGTTSLTRLGEVVWKTIGFNVSFHFRPSGAPEIPDQTRFAVDN